MIDWTFNLAEETDPLLRAGIHGLWRYLTHYGVQTDTCVWSLTDTKIKISFAAKEDLNALMRCQLGDFSAGIAVPPGYVSDKNSPEIYATVMAHRGVTQLFFTKKGASRSRSILEQETVNPVVTPWARTEKDRRFTMSFTHHRLHDDPPSIESLKAKEKLGILYHPMTAQWQTIQQMTTAKNKFIISFSCLSHVWAYDTQNGSPFGVAVDTDTFKQADDLHNVWKKYCVVSVPGEKSCFWVIATVLDLPSGSYITVSNTGAGLQTISDKERKTLYPMFRCGLSETNEHVSTSYLQRIDVYPQNSERTLYEEIVKNVQNRRKWYANVRPLDPGASVRKTFTQLLSFCEDKEKDVVIRFNLIRMGLVIRYREEFNQDEKKLFDKADHFISTELNRVINKDTLIRALDKICGRAWRKFSSEELEWLEERATLHHQELKTLLLLSATTFRPQLPETVSREASCI